MLMSARDKESGAPMGERELIDEVMTLIVAGHETPPGTQLDVVLLSRHPRRGAPARRDRAASELATPGLAPMEAAQLYPAVVNEALRLYPPGGCCRAGLSRRTCSAVTRCRPARTCCCAVTAAPSSGSGRTRRLSHRSACPSTKAERPRFAYMPSPRPRHCIGETFALYEMLMHLYKIARATAHLGARPAAATRGTDQPAHPFPPAHEAGTR